jgi:hypothetical protein
MITHIDKCPTPTHFISLEWHRSTQRTRVSIEVQPPCVFGPFASSSFVVAVVVDVVHPLRLSPARVDLPLLQPLFEFLRYRAQPSPPLVPRARDGLGSGLARPPREFEQLGWTHDDESCDEDYGDLGGAEAEEGMQAGGRSGGSRGTKDVGEMRRRRMGSGRERWRLGHRAARRRPRRRCYCYRSGEECRCESMTTAIDAAVLGGERCRKDGDDYEEERG